MIHWTGDTLSYRSDVEHPRWRCPWLRLSIAHGDRWSLTHSGANWINKTNGGNSIVPSCFPPPTPKNTLNRCFWSGTHVTPSSYSNPLSRHCSCRSGALPDAAPNGAVLGEDNWGGACDEGLRQSPIDLSYAASVRGYFPEFDFSEYDDIVPNANVTNNGHSGGSFPSPSLEIPD